MRSARHTLAVATAGAAAGLLVCATPATAGAGGPATGPGGQLAGPAVGCTIVGTPGPDVLRGTAGNDIMCGLDGNDILLGLGGNDQLYGGPGRDVLTGGPGRDLLSGGPGDDLLTDSLDASDEDGGPGADNCYGIRPTVFRACEHATYLR